MNKTKTFFEQIIQFIHVSPEPHITQTVSAQLRLNYFMTKERDSHE